MQDITRVANEAAQGLGIEVVDVRIKAIELPEDVRESVFRRMAADRQKEANLYRFEGREEAVEGKAVVKAADQLDGLVPPHDRDAGGLQRGDFQPGWYFCHAVAGAAADGRAGR